MSFEEDVQLLLFTDGALEAMGPSEVEATEQLKLITSQKWEDTSIIMDQILPPEQRENQPDDMCLLLVQAKSI